MPPRDPLMTPEREKEYPEPSMFGLIPASGLFIRHARGVRLSNVVITHEKEDRRPVVVLDQAADVELDRMRSDAAPNTPTLLMLKVDGVTVRGSAPVPDARIGKAERKEM